MNQFRQLYSKVINDKHDDVMAKFGAILAQGILDAGQYQNVDKCNTKIALLLISFDFAVKCDFWDSPFKALILLSQLVLVLVYFSFLLSGLMCFVESCLK